MTPPEKPTGDEVQEAIDAANCADMCDCGNISISRKDLETLIKSATRPQPEKDEYNALGFKIPKKLDDLIKKEMTFSQLEKLVEDYHIKGVPLKCWTKERHDLFKAAKFWSELFGIIIVNEKEKE